MLCLKLKRVSYLLDCTLGVLTLNGIPLALTLEPEWAANEKGISCIPIGSYICKRVQSPKFGNTFEVTNVPGRSNILFHIGNISDDTTGCIILGSKFGALDNKQAVLDSKSAMMSFFSALKDHDDFCLQVKSV